MAKEKEKEEPIYEKLAPGECMIISKKGKCVVYARNKDGKTELEEVCLSSKG